VDQHTRLVVTSHVSYLSGNRIDYRRLYQELKQTQTLLLLDATQSLGAVPVDMQETDFVVCSSYKWLLATHGVGILGVNPDRTQAFKSRAVGWRSVTDMFGSDRFDRYTCHADARRFELGYPSYPTVYTLNFTTGLLLDVGIERIERHILELGTQLIERLQGLGLEIMTPTRSEKRAGNIAVVCPDGEHVAEALQREGILVWGGDGRLRASVHLFNDEHDIERFTHVLEALGQTR
jgi:selenocysteine lyase/cysteine desulfurase